MRGWRKVAFAAIAATLFGCHKAAEPSDTSEIVSQNPAPAKALPSAVPLHSAPAIIPQEAIPSKPAKRKYRIGLWMPHLRESDGNLELATVEQQTKAAGVDLVSLYAGHVSLGADVVLVFGARQNDFAELDQGRAPFIAVASATSNKAACQIDSDWGEASFNEGQAVAKEGMSPIALIVFEQSPASKEITDGLTTGLLHNGKVKVNTVVVQKPDDISDLLTSKSAPGVIVTTSPDLTRSVLRAEDEAKTNIPVYGTDLNAEQNALLTKFGPLKGGTQADPQALGQTAVDAAIKYLNKEPLPKSILVPARFVSR